MNHQSSSLSIKELETRMRPGILSQGGFLGEKEPLEEVLARDAKTLQKLELTYEEIAKRLEKLIQAGETSSNHATQIEHFKIKVTVYTGFQICPWSPDIHSSQCTEGGGVQFGSLDWSIRNLKTGQEMKGSGLAVHLIRDHHFFEGFDSPYRLEPTKLAQLLELVQHK